MEFLSDKHFVSFFVSIFVRSSSGKCLVDNKQIKRKEVNTLLLGLVLVLLLKFEALKDGKELTLPTNRAEDLDFSV